jgi:hypothetical protein
MSVLPRYVGNIVLQKVIMAQMIKKFPSFMKSEDLMSYSQEPDTGSYPKPDESRPHPHMLLLTVTVMVWY